MQYEIHMNDSSCAYEIQNGSNGKAIMGGGVAHTRTQNEKTRRRKVQHAHDKKYHTDEKNTQKKQKTAWRRGGMVYIRNKIHM